MVTYRIDQQARIALFCWLASFGVPTFVAGVFARLTRTIGPLWPERSGCLGSKHADGKRLGVGTTRQHAPPPLAGD